jgi:hypothetical protein
MVVTLNGARIILTCPNFAVFTGENLIFLFANIWFVSRALLITGTALKRKKFQIYSNNNTFKI